MYQLTKQFYTLAVALGIVCMVTAMPQDQQEGPHTLLDIETPNQFSYNSPLAQPDSLRSKPYFDFLSTLYAHDSAKTNLFRNRPRRQAELEPELKSQVVVAAEQPKSRRRDRQRRAIVFRPLFVYKQQEIRKQEIAARRRSDQVNAGYNYNQLYNRL